MTCVVGIAQNGKSYIGGDNAGEELGKKVFEIGEFVMGFTYQAHQFTPPKIDDVCNDLVMNFMITKFVPELRKITENNECFLVGVRGRLFKIDRDFQVCENMDGYAAVGRGESYAIGSLYTSAKSKPKWRLQNALEAVAKFSGGVSAPFTFVHT